MGTITAERPRAAVRLAHHRWTVADVDRMLGSGLLDQTDRVELIEGELIDMAPIGSRHAYTVDAIARKLQRLLGDRQLVRVQNPIRLGELSEPQPDIAVVRDRSYAAAHPEAADVLLLIEVADTTLEFDRDVKLPLYARHGILESWLIDVAARQLSIHREPAEGEYRRIHRPTMGETLHLLDPQGPQLQVADLFAE
jgi:Uma2 family endonuclease